MTLLLFAFALIGLGPGSSAFATSRDCAQFLIDHPGYRKLPERLLADEDLRHLLGGPLAYADRTVALVLRTPKDGRKIFKRLRKQLEADRTPFVLISRRSRTNVGMRTPLPTLADVLRQRAATLEPLRDKVPPGTTLLFEGLDDVDDARHAFDVYMAVDGVRELFPRAYKIRVIYWSHYLDFDADGDVADAIAEHARVIRPPGRR